MKILIIEDDREIAGLLSLYLKKNQYETMVCHDGVAGLNELKAHTGDYDMILLDMMLPGFSGDELLPKFRSLSDIPVIVISAVSALEQRLFMMREGADDYIIKPFELPDVLVRIEAVLRRSRPSISSVAAQPDKGCLTYGRISIDTGSSLVSVSGNPVSLTTKEYDILLLFLENPGKLFSKANLFESVWNEDYYPEDTSLKVHIANLRSKLKKYDDFDYIETIWGMGYRLRSLT